MQQRTKLGLTTVVVVIIALLAGRLVRPDARDGVAAPPERSSAPTHGSHLPAVELGVPARVESAAPARLSEPALSAAPDRDQGGLVPPALVELGRQVTAPLHSRWEREPKDAKWLALEQEIEGFFHDPRLVGLEFISVDCRTTLCRYEVALADRRAFQNMLDIAKEERPFPSAMGIPAVSDDRLIMFLAPDPATLFGQNPSPEQIERMGEHFGVTPS